jgi:hypothetical protein
VLTDSAIAVWGAGMAWQILPMPATSSSAFQTIVSCVNLQRHRSVHGMEGLVDHAWHVMLHISDPGIL